jgi:adenosylmethionine-8-amino-7-oxononanoate aminotransferase
LLESPWQSRITRIENRLREGLAPCRDHPAVTDVRVLGGIGVVELQMPVDMKTMVPEFVAAGVWIRPFGRLVYLMPPYIISDEDLHTLTRAVRETVGKQA